MILLNNENIEKLRMNPCYYHIERFTYKPKGKSKLPESEAEFKRMVWSKSKDHQAEYPLWFQKEFIDYWTTVPDLKTKCRYLLLTKKEKEKWSTLGRMANAKRMLYRNDPRFKEKPIEYTKPKQALGYESDYVPPVPDYAKHAERVKGEVHRGSIGELIRKQVKR